LQHLQQLLMRVLAETTRDPDACQDILGQGRDRERRAHAQKRHEGSGPDGSSHLVDRLPDQQLHGLLEVGGIRPAHLLDLDGEGRIGVEWHVEDAQLGACLLDAFVSEQRDLELLEPAQTQLPDQSEEDRLARAADPGELPARPIDDDLGSFEDGGRHALLRRAQARIQAPQGREEQCLHVDHPVGPGVSHASMAHPRVTALAIVRSIAALLSVTL